MNRREFIKSSAVGLGGIVLFPACVYEKTPYRFFTEPEANCIIALTDQIIPEDEYGPGAVYANVINYIDKQLIEVFTYEQGNYRSGIDSLQKSCKKSYAKKFDELEFSVQTKVLTDLESNKLVPDYWNEINGPDFFRMVINHTMQGFYGSPRHGGNKNYISYRLMDLEYPLIIGQNRYRDENG